MECVPSSSQQDHCSTIERKDDKIYQQSVCALLEDASKNLQPYHALRLINEPSLISFHNRVNKCKYHINRHHHIESIEQNSRKGNTFLSSVKSSPINYLSKLYPTTNCVPSNNSAFIEERYLLLERIESTNLFKCLDAFTGKLLQCKIATNPCSNLLTAHFRLEGHQHVNHLEKVITTNKQTYLFYNISKGDLHSFIRIKKRLRENEAQKLFRQICDVVNTCHEQGIILRDLKLRKFVFSNTEKTHLKLETLEDAVILENKNDDMLHDKRGCPAYVSPEILKSNTKYSGKAADMWSLGVILYTMLVGRYPFNDVEHANLFAKISRGHYVIPECISSKARCIIRALLRRDPDERITSEDILHHPWLKEVDNNDSKAIPIVDEQVVPRWIEPDQ